MAFALSLLEVNTDNSLANQRVFRDRLNPIDSYNDIEFISRYRITRNIFFQLHEEIAGYLLKPRICSSHPIPTITQFAVALQFLATGSFQTVIASSHGISQPSVSRCIAVVTDDLCSIAKDYIKRARYACSRYASCCSLLLVLGPSALGKGENYL